MPWDASFFHSKSCEILVPQLREMHMKDYQHLGKPVFWDIHRGSVDESVGLYTENHPQSSDRFCFEALYILRKKLMNILSPLGNLARNKDLLLGVDKPSPWTMDRANLATSFGLCQPSGRNLACSSSLALVAEECNFHQQKDHDPRVFGSVTQRNPPEKNHEEPSSQLTMV